MRLLLLSFYVVFSFGLNAQNFHQKYDIDGLMEIADYTEPKSTFKKFKSHLDDLGFMYDKSFTYEYERALGFNDRLPKYPLAAAYYRDVVKAQKAIPISLISAYLAPIFIYDLFF